MNLKFTNILHILLTVKSYVSDFLRDGTASQNIFQYSRHLLANLTTLLGLPDTYLYMDVVFQDSFLPRSLRLNLSSPLLKHFGGSIQVNLKAERKSLFETCQVVCECSACFVSIQVSDIKIDLHTSNVSTFINIF